MDYLFIFLLGTIIGSFLNVCIYRIPRGESIAFPPSHCTKCKNKIKPYDLIPVGSYIFLKGKCRYCREKISIIYPLIELFTGIIYLFLYIKFGLSLSFIKYAVLVSFLIVIGMIDYFTTDVYFKVTMPGIIIGLIFAVAAYFMKLNLMTYIFGGILGYGVIALIILLTHGMGWGDAEICALSGAFLGLRLSALNLFLSIVIGGITGIILLVLKVKKRGDYIPLGPSICLAGIVTVLFGNEILKWYFTFI